RGPGPVLLGAARPQDDPQVQAATDAELLARLVGPLQERLSGDALRAELGVAAFVGVALCRAAGGMTALAGADADVVADLLHDLLGGLLEAGTGTLPG
ncbi:MAG: TetR/AcrR family transcriptional regulator, partial [Frankiales bacterium]|nr:TetR/AcrR family transcriptional regulator [Frankiales bacterium]